MKDAIDTDNPDTSDFISDWLKTANLEYRTKVSIPREGKCIDYLIPELSIGIMIINWKKPISVKIINRAIAAMNSFDLYKLYIVCNAISDYAEHTINRLNYNISVVHPYGLSEIAIPLLSHRKIRDNPVAIH